MQKNNLRSAKNEVFFLFCILVDKPMGGGGYNQYLNCRGDGGRDASPIGIECPQ